MSLLRWPVKSQSKKRSSNKKLDSVLDIALACLALDCPGLRFGLCFGLGLWLGLRGSFRLGLGRLLGRQTAHRRLGQVNPKCVHACAVERYEMSKGKMNS